MTLRFTEEEYKEYQERLKSQGLLSNLWLDPMKNNNTKTEAKAKDKPADRIYPPFNPLTGKRTSKYHAVRTEVDTIYGKIKCDSKAEAQHVRDANDLVKAGLI